jgi:hypothetical protein
MAQSPPSSIDSLTDEDLYRLIEKINDDNAFRPSNDGAFFTGEAISPDDLKSFLRVRKYSPAGAILTHDHYWMPAS